MLTITELHSNIVTAKVASPALYYHPRRHPVKYTSPTFTDIVVEAAVFSNQSGTPKKDRRLGNVLFFSSKTSCLKQIHCMQLFNHKLRKRDHEYKNKKKLKYLPLFKRRSHEMVINNFAQAFSG